MSETEVKRVVTTAYKLAIADLEKAELDIRRGMKEFFFKLVASEKKLKAMRSRIEEIYGNEPDPDLDESGMEESPTTASEVHGELEENGTGMGDLDEVRGMLAEVAKQVATWKRDLAKRQEELLDIIDDR